METQTLSEEWDVLLTFLPEGWEEKAYETRAFSKRRNIKDPETLLRVLLIHLAEGKSLRTTVTYAQEAGLCSINDTALLKRLRGSGDWLRWLADSLRQEINQPIPETQFTQNHRVRLIDGSMISEPGSTGSDWRLHYSLNLKTLHCDDFQVTDCHTGESFKYFSVEPGDLLIGDRSYCKGPGVVHVSEHGGDVLVRFHSTALPLYNHQGNRYPLLEKLRELKGTRVGDWKVYVYKPNGERIAGRICAKRKSREAIEKDKKKILKTASKKQRKVKPETLEFSEYTVVFTTVSRHRLKGKAIMELYRCRWQVELSFKRLKSILNIGHLPKYDPDSCVAWLHGKLFVAMLVERIHMEAESFSPWGYPI